MYSITLDKTIANYKKNTIAQAEKAATTIDAEFNNVATELKSYMNIYTPDKLSQAESFAVTKKLFDNRVSKNIDSLFFSKNEKRDPDNLCPNTMKITATGRPPVQPLCSDHYNRHSKARSASNKKSSFTSTVLENFQQGKRVGSLEDYDKPLFF